MVILALPWSWLDSSFGEKAPWWSFLIVSLIVSGVLALGLKMDDLYDKTEIWLVDILTEVRELRLEQARELLSRYEESGMTGEELKEKRLEEFKESMIRILDGLIEEKKDELARIQKGKRRRINEKMDELRRKQKENIQRIQEDLDKLNLDKLDKLDKIVGRLIEDEEKESS